MFLVFVCLVYSHSVMHWVLWDAASCHARAHLYSCLNFDLERALEPQSVIFENEVQLKEGGQQQCNLPCVAVC